MKNFNTNFFIVAVLNSTVLVKFINYNFNTNVLTVVLTFSKNISSKKFRVIRNQSKNTFYLITISTN